MFGKIFVKFWCKDNVVRMKEDPISFQCKSDAPVIQRKGMFHVKGTGKNLLPIMLTQQQNSLQLDV